MIALKQVERVTILMKIKLIKTVNEVEEVIHT